MGGRPDISLIVNTFRKPGHLALVLESIARQEGVAGRFEVVVSDDGSTDTTQDVVEAFAARAPFPVAFTTLPHDGFRLARTRNQGARLAVGRALLFLDGDCVLPRDHVAAHLDRLAPGRALLGFCARLDEAVSRSLDVADLRPGTIRRLVPRAERAALAARHRKATWHAAFRHATKPRLAGGNFSVWREDFARVNGCDERFVGWGQEDDDLGLRLRASGVRLESILDRTWTLHVWHPTDPSATARWRDGTNVAYFSRHGRLTACRHGLVHRALPDLAWRLPDDLFAGEIGRDVAAAIGATAARERSAEGPSRPSARPEVDLVVRPGAGEFHGPAECRLLVAATAQRGGRRPADRAARLADVHLVAAADDRPLAERLAAAL
ncbi:MAG: glycosyltransferase [Planctomycetaceae bacterium]